MQSSIRVASTDCAEDRVEFSPPRALLRSRFAVGIVVQTECANGASVIRSMCDSDTDWAAGLMADRRVEYAAYSPVFWRPRPDVEPAHARFLGSQISDPLVIALRGDYGFAIATLTGDQYYVDDFAVANDRWQDMGAELRSAVWRHRALRRRL